MSLLLISQSKSLILREQRLCVRFRLWTYIPFSYDVFLFRLVIDTYNKSKKLRPVSHITFLISRNDRKICSDIFQYCYSNLSRREYKTSGDGSGSKYKTYASCHHE